MAVNRLTHLLCEPETTNNQPSGVPVGFALCPIFLVQVQSIGQAAMLEIYRRAYEQAQAQARMARIEKRFFSVWN